VGRKGRSGLAAVSANAASTGAPMLNCRAQGSQQMPVLPAARIRSDLAAMRLAAERAHSSVFLHAPGGRAGPRFRATKYDVQKN